MSDLTGVTSSEKSNSSSMYYQPKAEPESDVREFRRFLGRDGGNGDTPAYFSIDEPTVFTSSTMLDPMGSYPNLTEHLQTPSLQQNLSAMASNDSSVDVKYLMTSFANGLFARSAVIQVPLPFPEARHEAGQDQAAVMFSASGKLGLHEVACNVVKEKVNGPVSMVPNASSSFSVTNALPAAPKQMKGYAEIQEHKRQHKRMQAFNGLDGLRIYIRDRDVTSESINDMTASNGMFRHLSMLKCLWLNGRKII